MFWKNLPKCAKGSVTVKCISLYILPVSQTQQITSSHDKLLDVVFELNETD